MPAPFVLKNPESSGWLSRVTGNKKGALIEINNLFARATSLSTVVSSEIANACRKHGVRLEKVSERSELYEKYVAHAFRDKVVTDGELAVVNRLQELLALDEATMQRAYWDPILELYGKEIDSVVSDGALTDPDRERLRQLERDLRIPSEQAKRVYDARAGKKVKDYVADMIGDSKVSPEEEQKLQQMCTSLDVELDWEDSEQTFSRFKENWQLEHGELVPVDVDIHLQRRESCFACRDVDWYETRKVTKRIGYSGPTARLRIMKGVYWRVVSIGVQRVSEDVMTHMDSGKVYLTNKRLVFMGRLGNKSIRLSRILDYEVYSNGVTVQKDAGKSPFLRFDAHPERFGVLLGRVLNEAV